MGIINLLNFLEVFDDTSLFSGDTDAPCFGPLGFKGRDVVKFWNLVAHPDQ